VIALLLWQFVFTLDASDPAIAAKIYKQRQVLPDQTSLINEEVASETEATTKPGFCESLSNP